MRGLAARCDLINPRSQTRELSSHGGSSIRAHTATKEAVLFAYEVIIKRLEEFTCGIDWQQQFT